MDPTLYCLDRHGKRRYVRRQQAGILTAALMAASATLSSAQTPERAVAERAPAAPKPAAAGAAPAVTRPGTPTPGTAGSKSAAPPAAGKAAAGAPKGKGAGKNGATVKISPAGPGKTGAPMPPPGGVPMPAPIPTPPAIPAAPPGMIKLDFHGTNIDTVLQAFHMAYKWTIIKDPKVQGDVTIIETTPMDQKRALQVLAAVLEVQGFTARLDGNLLKVMPMSRAIRTPGIVRFPEPTTPSPADEQVITDVVPLSSAEASVLAKDLEPLLSEGAKMIAATGANALIITDTTANINRVKSIVKSLDKGAGNNELEIFHLKHVPAKKMSTIINDLFKQIAPRAPAAPPNPNQPPPQPGQPGAGAAGGARPAVAAVDDERTNSVIVVGSKENLTRVKEIVEKLDEELNPHTITKVYEVKFADAQKLAELVNAALIGDESQSRNNNNFNPFNPFGGGGNRNQQRTVAFQAGETHIVADQRTNTLVITADDDMMKVVEDLLVRLDKPVEYETTTFVIPLKNVNAMDMAYILSQAFGTTQQNPNDFFGGFFFGDGFGGGGSRRIEQRIKRRLDDSRSSADGEDPDLPSTGFRPGRPGGGRLADASGRPELPPGAEQLAQFFYDYYGYGRGQRGSDATTGRNQAGNFVNLIQLRGNVIVTPERNTNSLIITTTPEAAAKVKELIADLDVEVKQVLLEAVVAEVTLDKDTKFGIDYLFQDLKNKIEGVFPVLPSRGALGSDPLAAGFRHAIFRGNFQAVISAIARDERVNILSTPRVFTMNNQQAQIEVTDTLPYQSGTINGFSSSNVTTDFKDVGLILDVTPRITADGMVTVDVYQEDSNLVQFKRVGRGGAEAPITTQRVTDTSVTLQNGDTLILSGLQKDSVHRVINKIPILGDIPLLGKLFSSTAKQRKRTELVVFLTPRVVNSAREARELTNKELDRVQKSLPEIKRRIPGLEHITPVDGSTTQPDAGK